MNPYILSITTQKSYFLEGNWDIASNVLLNMRMSFLKRCRTRTDNFIGVVCGSGGRAGGSVPGFCSLRVKVRLGKKLNPMLAPMHLLECECVSVCV